MVPLKLNNNDVKIYMCGVKFIITYLQLGNQGFSARHTAVHTDIARVSTTVQNKKYAFELIGDVIIWTWVPVEFSSIKGSFLTFIACCHSFTCMCI